MLQNGYWALHPAIYGVISLHMIDGCHIISTYTMPTISSVICVDYGIGHYRNDHVDQLSPESDIISRQIMNQEET